MLVARKSVCHSIKKQSKPHSLADEFVYYDHNRSWDEKKFTITPCPTKPHLGQSLAGSVSVRLEKLANYFLAMPLLSRTCQKHLA